MYKEIEKMDWDNPSAPPEDCMTEDGKVDKYKYMLTLPSYTKKDLERTYKIVRKLVKENQNRYYRLNVLGTDFGCIFDTLQKPSTDSDFIKNFNKEIVETVKTCVIDVKGFNFNNPNDYNSIEIWGVNDKGEGVILFLFPYDQAVFEV